MKPLSTFDLLAPAPATWAGQGLLAVGLLLMSLALIWPLDPMPAGSIGTSAAPQPQVRRVQLPASPVAPDWADLFALLQRHGRGPVALLELTPQANPGRIELVGQTPSLQSMVEWLQELETDPQLSDVTLTSHAARVAKEGEEGKGTTYRFVVQARWHAVAASDAAPARIEPATQGDNIRATPG